MNKKFLYVMFALMLTAILTIAFEATTQKIIEGLRYKAQCLVQN